MNKWIEIRFSDGTVYKVSLFRLAMYYTIQEAWGSKESIDFLYNDFLNSDSEYQIEYLKSLPWSTIYSLTEEYDNVYLDNALIQVIP